MSKLNRRQAIGGILSAGVGVLSLNETENAQTDNLAMAFAGKHQPRALPFDAAKLKGILEKLIKSHLKCLISHAFLGF